MAAIEQLVVQPPPTPLVTADRRTVCVQSLTHTHAHTLASQIHRDDSITAHDTLRLTFEEDVRFVTWTGFAHLPETALVLAVGLHSRVCVYTGTHTGALTDEDEFTGEWEEIPCAGIVADHAIGTPYGLLLRTAAPSADASDSSRKGPRTCCWYLLSTPFSTPVRVVLHTHSGAAHTFTTDAQGLDVLPMLSDDRQGDQAALGHGSTERRPALRDMPVIAVRERTSGRVCLYAHANTVMQTTESAAPAVGLEQQASRLMTPVTHAPSSTSATTAVMSTGGLQGVMASTPSLPYFRAHSDAIMGKRLERADSIALRDEDELQLLKYRVALADDADGADTAGDFEWMAGSPGTPAIRRMSRRRTKSRLSIARMAAAAYPELGVSAVTSPRGHVSLVSPATNIKSPRATCLTSPALRTQAGTSEDPLSRSTLLARAQSWARPFSSTAQTHEALPQPKRRTAASWFPKDAVDEDASETVFSPADPPAPNEVSVTSQTRPYCCVWASDSWQIPVVSTCVSAYSIFELAAAASRTRSLMAYSSHAGSIVQYTVTQEFGDGSVAVRQVATDCLCVVAWSADGNRIVTVPDTAGVVCQPVRWWICISREDSNGLCSRVFDGERCLLQCSFRAAARTSVRHSPPSVETVNACLQSVHSELPLEQALIGAVACCVAMLQEVQPNLTLDMCHAQISLRHAAGCLRRTSESRWELAADNLADISLLQVMAAVISLRFASESTWVPNFAWPFQHPGDPGELVVQARIAAHDPAVASCVQHLMQRDARFQQLEHMQPAETELHDVGQTASSGWDNDSILAEVLGLTLGRATDLQRAQIAARILAMHPPSASTLLSLPETQRARLLMLIGRQDLAYLITRTCMQAERVANASVTQTQMPLLHRVLLAPAQDSGSLGVLHTQGIVGRPPHDVAVAALAAAAVVTAVLGHGDMSAGATADQDPDGVTAAIQRLGARVFPGDARLHTSAYTLQACRPLQLSIVRKPEDTDHDFLAAQQAALLQAARMRMGAAVGRAMLTYATVAHNYAAPISLPVVTVAGRLPPHDTLVKLDISGIGVTHSGMTEWPEFHNGFAAAVRACSPAHTHINAGAALDMSNAAAWRGWLSARATSSPDALRTWVRSHMFTGTQPDLATIAATAATVAAGLAGSLAAAALPAPGIASGVVPPNPGHGGLLMGLGVLGYLNTLSPSDIVGYLNHTHGATTVGVLLGLAAGRAGSMDTHTWKALCLHIPAILPGQHHDIEVPSYVQACAIAGLGLLYAQTGHVGLTRFLTAQLGRGPSSDRMEDKESLANCAGFALGLMHLARGDAACDGDSQEIVLGETQLKLDDLLIHYVRGGVQSDAAGAGRGRDDDGKDATTSGQPLLVRHGARVDTNTTATPAVIALGLIFLRTGAKRIADALAAPQSFAELDACRPDILLQRMTARTLILWDDLHDGTPERGVPARLGAAISHLRAEHARRNKLREWMKCQVPARLRRVMQRVVKQAQASAAASSGSIMAQILADIRREKAAAGGTNADQPPASGTQAARPAPNPAAEVDTDVADGKLDELDLDQAKALYICTIAGLCLGLGLRYAGTRDATVRDAILEQLLLGHAMRESHDKDAWFHCERLLDGLLHLHAKQRDAALTLAFRETRLVGGDAGALERLQQLASAPRAQDDLLQAIPMPFTGSIGELRVKQGGRLGPHVEAAPADERLSLQALQAACASRSIVDMAVATMSLAIAYVMAGSADVSTLRVLREIRSRVERTVSYGIHMALGAALGMLTLGSGRMTLARDPMSIAALWIAAFPLWPHGTATNHYLPQAIRNLWVLATDARCLDTIDAHTLAPVSCAVSVTIRGIGSDSERVLQMRTPCVLPELEHVQSICIVDPAYEPVEATVALAKQSLPGNASKLTAGAAGHYPIYNPPHLARQAPLCLIVERRKRDPSALRQWQAVSSSEAPLAGPVVVDPLFALLDDIENE